MSLDLSVLMNKKMSKDLIQVVDNFLIENGFVKDEYGYVAANENISLDIYCEFTPEKDDWWDDVDELIAKIGFFPKAEIVLESKHAQASHIVNYQTAQRLAAIVGGVIYDYQVGVLYDSDGKPYACHRTDGEFEEYGAGIGMFMAAVGIVKDILDTESNG